ncbi:MAG: 50S ribosomal protein L37ae [Candidatus Nanoarchaeia archaeon]
MAVKTKKIKSAGRFSAGYGLVRNRLITIEQTQRKKQICPACKGIARRQSKGIWLCKKCGRTFTSGTYSLKN